MTELLEQAIAKLKTLPIDEQDTIATLILEELEAEHQWDELFAVLQICCPSLQPRQWQSIVQAKLRN